MAYRTEWNTNDTLHGSARWADWDDVKSAGLMDGDGLPFGYFDDARLSLGGDAPRITIGGAGCGKTRDLLGTVLCLPCPMPMMILDPRGELWDISVGTLAPQNIFAYSWDPFITGDVQHSINVLDHLTPENPNLFGQITRLVRALIPLLGGGNSRYFELSAQNILIALIYNDVLRRGGISFPRLYELIYIVESGTQAWPDLLEEMLASGNQFLVSAANTMMIKQQDVPKEFSAFMGEIFANTMWLNDDAVRNALKGGDASLQELVDPALNGGHIVRLHLKVPGDQLEQLAPILRVFFDTLMVLKSRRPQAQRVLLLIDEAAMLGRFSALQTAFSFGRGSGVLTWAIFQSLSQIEQNFGRAGIQTFLGSSAMRQFMGVRDLDTARVVSAMCGRQTVFYDDERVQAEADYRMQEQIMGILDGSSDPFAAGQSFAHFEEASQRKSKMQRWLIEPDEVLGLREDEAITFLSGRNVPPIFHNKYPYYERLKAGQFFPNPNHPPTNRIRVRKRGLFSGHEWLAVRRRPVPAKYRQFPQYANGTALEIEGHPL